MQKHFMPQRQCANNLQYNHAGAVVLVSVLLIGAIGTAIATTLILLGLNSTRLSFSLEQSHQSQALATACAETALQAIWANESITGTQTLTLGAGTCTYTITNLGGEQRKITVSGTVQNVTRKAQLSISALNPAITVSSWQEIADFQ